MKNLLFLILLFAARVEAIPRLPSIPLHIVSVDNSYMRPIVRDRAVRKAIEYYKGQGVRIAKARVERRADPFRELRTAGATLLSFNEEFYSWFVTLRGEKKLLEGLAVHVLAPPFAVAGIRYMGGFAFLGRFFSYSTAQEYNSSGAYRFRHTVVGIVHEMGHSVFGCEHEQGSNVMHPDAFLEQNKIEATGRLLPLGPGCRAKIKQYREKRRINFVGGSN
jgi:hypothetical protein